MKFIRTILPLVVFSCLLAASTVSVAAQHAVFPNDDGSKICLFNGTITMSDALDFIAKDLPSGCDPIYLNSSGGDVVAAMKLGRVIRSRKLAVVVNRNMSCASACVFVYAGGVIRLNYGPVLVHRPYSPTATNDTMEQTQARFGALETQIRSFLREMNVSERLFERMRLIPPERVEALSLDDMRDLGIGFFDPVYEEYLTNQEALRVGLPKADYMRRAKQATDACGAISGYIPPGVDLEARKRCWRGVFPQAVR